MTGSVSAAANISGVGKNSLGSFAPNQSSVVFRDIGVFVKQVTSCQFDWHCINALIAASAKPFALLYNVMICDFTVQADGEAVELVTVLDFC